MEIDENTVSPPIGLGAMFKDTRLPTTHPSGKKMCKLNMHATRAVCSILHARREVETTHRKPG